MRKCSADNGVKLCAHLPGAPSCKGQKIFYVFFYKESNTRSGFQRLIFHG